MTGCGEVAYCACPGTAEAHLYWLLRHECITSRIPRPDNEFEYYS